ncbi:sesquipedalian-1 isoform X2 [Gouania willdenowi]|uniref:Sesquipedalian n=2 Tax=Gouania willdenowi TaxID=441366 RepID=A0A8C5E2G6_GOUWI|nr:sesquipedalian-1-like isoform X2 [Gouania willdenowi]XP_028311269.1 sesquipedalian-1-like isoform X2 [Gouania willdenowi]
MKLHEKILTHFLSCTSPVDKEGYLYKKKERTGTFHRRWFVLKANLLFYQERPADRHLLGVIILEGCAVRQSECDGPSVFSLEFGPGLKTYMFEATDRQNQESWVNALSSASHRYLSLLLRDLERQYEEAKQSPGSSEAFTGAFKQSTTSLMSTSDLIPKVRQKRSLSAPPTSTKVVSKKSPKLWARRNAHVTPLNGPVPLYAEWPLVGLDPANEFIRLHEHYGLEVKKAREEWLKVRVEEDLIDLN